MLCRARLLSPCLASPVLESLLPSLPSRTARNETGDTPVPLVVSIQTGGCHPPLFFVHGLAGNLVRFNNLIRHLGRDESVYVLQEQSLDQKEPILTRVEDMAAQYIQAIQAVQPRGPYFLTGYSFGGLVCFEMAQQLRSQGHDVVLVALIDTGQPIYRKDRATVLRSPRMLRTYFRRLKELLSDAGSRSTLRSRIRNELLRLIFLKLPVRKVMHRFSKTDSHDLPRTPAMLQAANVEAAMRYEPRRYPGRISVFRAQERTMVDRFDRQLGWGGLADQVDVYDVPGDHVTIAEEPYVGVLAEKFRLAIQAARDKHE